MPTQIKSTTPIYASSVRQNTSAQDQFPAALSTSISSGDNAISKRRTRKVVYTGSSEFMERAGRLGTDERRILKDYAGDTTKTRTLVLEKLESYRRQNNNQPPIVELDSQASPDGSTKLWKCMVCRQPKMFPTFQRVALHVTSTHWRLLSWPCRVNSCTRSYQALDQLRRHMKVHPREGLTLTGSTPSPASAPSPRPRPMAADRIQPRPFIAPPDGNTQAATSSGFSHVWSGFMSTNTQRQPFEQPPREFISQLQLQASSVLDLPPPSLPFPVMNELEFSGIFLPDSEYASLPSTSISMNAFPLTVNNAGQRVRLTGYTQHGQPNTSGFPKNQDFPQNDVHQSDLATHWHDYPASRQAGPSLSPVTNASSFSTNRSRSMMNRGGVEAPSYLDYPTFSQPGPGPSSASNIFYGPMTYSAPSSYSMSYSPPEDLMRREMSSEYTSVRRLGRQEFADFSEEMASDTFQGSDQAPWGS